MTSASMLKNRYFDDDDDDDESSTASIRTENEYEANHASAALTTNPISRANVNDDDDDEAAIAAQYAKKKSAAQGLLPSLGTSGGNIDPKRRKVDARPKITMETILDSTYGISQLVTHLPVRMKSVTPDPIKSNGSRSGSSTANSRNEAAKKYMNTLLQAYYDIIMNDWLQIPSLTTSSSSTSSTSNCSNVQQQQILQDVFYKVETLGMNKGPMKDAITSLRHVHCRNPLLYNAIGVNRANTILQQYEQEQELQGMPQPQYDLDTENVHAAVDDPSVNPIPNRTPPPSSSSLSVPVATVPPNHEQPQGASSSLSSSISVVQTQTPSVPNSTTLPTTASNSHTSSSIDAAASSATTMMDKSKENDSDDDEPMHRVSHIAPANVLPSSNDDSDEGDDAKMMRNTTTNPVGPRNSNNKRRYILEDSDDE